MSNFTILAIIAIAIFTVYMAVVGIFKRNRLQERVSAAGGFTPDEDTAPPLSVVFCENLLAMTGANMRDQKPVALQLQQAGIGSPHAVVYYLFFKRFIQPIVFVLGAFIFGKALLTVGAPFISKLFNLGLGIILLGVGLFGANLYVTNRKQRRQQQLMRSFPEGLDLLLVCIESGLGLDAALGRVTSEMRGTHPELTQELERTRIELTVMSDRSQALQNLAERTDVVAFKSLVASLIQTEKFGTSLLDTLRVLSEEQRITRLLNAENRAARIPVLVTIPLIFCILPALIIVILGPPIVKVIEQGGIFGSATPK